MQHSQADSTVCGEPYARCHARDGFLISAGIRTDRKVPVSIGCVVITPFPGIFGLRRFLGVFLSAHLDLPPGPRRTALDLLIG